MGQYGGERQNVASQRDVLFKLLLIQEDCLLVLGEQTEMRTFYKTTKTI